MTDPASSPQADLEENGFSFLRETSGPVTAALSLQNYFLASPAARSCLLSEISNIGGHIHIKLVTVCDTFIRDSTVPALYFGLYFTFGLNFIRPVGLFFSFVLDFDCECVSGR